MKDTRFIYKDKFSDRGTKYKLIAIVDHERPLISNEEKSQFSCFKMFQNGEKVSEYYLPVAYDKDLVKQQFDLMKAKPKSFLNIKK